MARRIGAIGFLLAAALPVLLFRRVVADVWAGFEFDLHHLLGWAPWFFIAAGLAFLVPVAWSAGGDPESRWYPRARNAYAGWGVTLYLLGFLLAFQVAALHRPLH
jgi:hypothetical protein